MMSVQIRLIGKPVHIELITRDLRYGYRVVEERDYPSRHNPEYVRRYLTIATEVATEFGDEPVEGFKGIKDE